MPQTQSKGLELGCLLAADTPHTIVGDPNRLRQILTNLIGNAVKFTSQGEVVVHVQNHTVDGNRYLHFAVRDTGIGISQDAIARLFQSFSQVNASTTRHYGGTGLGLAISRRLSELMGGKMWVESKVGVGSTFHFTIQVQMVPAHIRAQRPALCDLAGKRVLLVDDHAVSLEILVRQLSNWHMLPVPVSSGQAALDRVAAGEHFDLAILDHDMPEMDGMTLAACLRLRPQGEHLAVVMLSSLTSRAAEAKELVCRCAPSLLAGALRKSMEFDPNSYGPWAHCFEAKAPCICARYCTKWHIGRVTNSPGN